MKPVRTAIARAALAIALAVGVAVGAAAALAGDDAAPGDAAHGNSAPKDAAPADPAQVAESRRAKDAALRRRAAQEAKNLPDDKLLAPLSALLDDPDAGVRRAAIDALACRVPVEAQEKEDAGKRRAEKKGRKDGEGEGQDGVKDDDGKK